MLTPTQLRQYGVLGTPVDSETDHKKAFAAEEVYCVTDYAKQTREPVYIRIQNVGTEPIYYAEDISDGNGNGTCSAELFTGIIPAASTTTAGDGGTLEWQKHRPKKIYIFGTLAYRAAIVRRYAEDN